MHPRLLTSVVLVDPVIRNSSTTPNPANSDANYARLSTFRRDHWPSRTKAAESFKNSKFYQTWDPRALDLWIRYGLRRLPTTNYPGNIDGREHSEDSDADDGPVTLATNKNQEVFMFLRPNFDGKDANGNLVINRQTHPDIDLDATFIYPFYLPVPEAVFKNLPHLRPSALYLFGGASEMSTPDLRRHKLDSTGTGVGGSGGVREGRVKEEVVEGVGHLVPMIAPKECADAAAGFLSTEVKRWKKDEEEWRRQWDSKDRLEKMTINEEWKKNMGGDPRAKLTLKL